jgi:hypothetical protein
LAAQQGVFRFQRQGGGLPAAQALVLLAQAVILLADLSRSCASAMASRTAWAGSEKAA